MVHLKYNTKSERKAKEKCLKKREKHPWRSVHFSKVAKINTPPWCLQTYSSAKDKGGKFTNFSGFLRCIYGTGHFWCFQSWFYCLLVLAKLQLCTSGITLTWSNFNMDNYKPLQAPPLSEVAWKSDRKHFYFVQENYFHAFAAKGVSTILQRGE